MFEDALVESGGKLRTHRGWSSGVAAMCNLCVACLLLLLPLLHPASLPKQALSTLLAAPAPPAPPLVRVARFTMATMPTIFLNAFTAPRVIPDRIVSAEDESLPGDSGPVLDARGSGSFSGLPDSIGSASIPQVHVVPPKRAVISSGVMEGHKLSGVNPRYPKIAIASHVQGTVVLAATISRTGTIENLRLLSGSPILSVAAEDAVRTWRYRPYMLNGEPVEVETTVNVIFHLATE
ncbi:MAG TPA: energy transducer TonB [Acidobacteriaceae bacterium]|jgi:protein TonB|nr:energy transducer TonB [Acidobacteriaceae bacterium]